MAPSPSPAPRPPPPPWIGLGPPAAGALLLGLRGELAPAWPLLGTAALAVAICELVAAVTRARGERQPALRPVSDAGVGLARLVSVAVGSLEAMIAVAIGLGERQSVSLLVVVGLLMLVVAVATGVQRLSRALAEVRKAGHGALVKGYGPLIYSNKEDPRIWVPKLATWGYTLNFAHAASWAILAAALALPLGVAAVALAAAFHR